MLCCYLVCSWNYTQVSVHHIYHFRLTASPSVACACEAPLVQERADDSEAWGGGRMVEFFAQSCPHCKHLEPIWKDASHKWAEQGQERENVVNQWKWLRKFYGEDEWIFKRKIEKIQAEFVKIHGQSSGMITWFGNQLDANGLEDSVRWEQKECYGENWAEGKDHDECMKEGIHSFPTVRFFSNLACRCL